MREPQKHLQPSAPATERLDPVVILIRAARANRNDVDVTLGTARASCHGAEDGQPDRSRSNLRRALPRELDNPVSKHVQLREHGDYGIPGNRAVDHSRGNVASL